MTILRVAPYYPVMTWTVGGNGMAFMHFEREALPSLTAALARFVLEKRKNTRPFTC